MRKRNDNENHLLSDQNLRFTCGNMSSIREYGFRVVLNFRAMALILIPVLIRAITVICCSSFSTEGHPNLFPAAFARVIPECVRSSCKSLSNSVTAERTCMVIFLSGWSDPPRPGLGNEREYLKQPVVPPFF